MNNAVISSNIKVRSILLWFNFVKKKLFQIIGILSLICAAGFLSQKALAQTQHTISGTVYLDSNRDGIQNNQETIPPNTRIKITHNNKTSFVEVESDGNYTYHTPQSGIFSVALIFPRQIQGSERYTKSIYLSNTLPKATANFSVVQNMTPPIASFTTQDISLQSTYPDCDFNRAVTCGDSYFCEDQSTESRWCSYDDTHEWCVDFIDYCQSGQSCSNGHCGGNGGGGGQTCGDGVDAPCCNGSCSDDLNLVCTSLPRGTSSNSCQSCGGQGQFCCTNARCNTGLTCSNYVCQQNITYSVSGFVYIDHDGNGTMSAGDTPFPQSITLTLQPGGGSPISVQTNNGYYAQTVSVAGSYSIGISPVPSGYRATTQNPRAFQLNNTTQTQTIDFGLTPQEYKVSGVVFIDTNKNGVKDANEIGSGGETVSVAGSSGELNAQTNSSGQYTRILPFQGNYTIRLLTRPQFDNTNAEIRTFSITGTNQAPIFDFGIYPKVTPTASASAAPVVKITKPATDGLTVKGIIEVQAVASVSGSTITSFKICTDLADDCLNADPTALNKSTVTVNVPGGADTTGLSNGNHTLTATAVAANGKTGEGKRTINVQNSTPTLSPTKTPTPTNPVHTNTPTQVQGSTATPTTSPTPGACNNNQFCDFGENVNTCPADCAVRCGDNVCSASENTFSCAADCTETNPSPTPTGTTGATNSPTRNPSHTATPTNPGSTNSPTPTNAGGITNTPTPTRNPAFTATPTVIGGQTGTPGGSTATPSVSPSPQDIVLNVSVKLPGIGNKSGDNANPKNSTKTVSVALYNSANQFAKQATGVLTFDGTVYKGSVNMGPVPAGSYTAYIKTSNSLIKRLSGTVTGGTGASLTIPQVELITGDFDQTNKLDIVDYNRILSCYGKDQQGNLINILGVDPNTFACGPQDLNDDGKVDEKDVNIFLRGFAIKEGDKP